MSGSIIIIFGQGEEHKKFEKENKEGGGSRHHIIIWTMRCRESNLN